MEDEAAISHEERVAIAMHDGGLTEWQAEAIATIQSELANDCGLLFDQWSEKIRANFWWWDDVSELVKSLNGRKIVKLTSVSATVLDSEGNHSLLNYRPSIKGPARWVEGRREREIHEHL